MVVLALVLIAVIAVAFRVVTAVRFGPVLDEHDSYFNHRVAQKISTDGVGAALRWFDPTVWYPFGRHIGATMLPGLPLFASVVADVAGKLFSDRAPDLESICIFVPPAAAALATLAGFALTRELLAQSSGPLLSSSSWTATRQLNRSRGRKSHSQRRLATNNNNTVGASLLAAAFLACTPGMLQRSLVGKFDNECLGVPLVLWFFREWLVAVRCGGAADVGVGVGGGRMKVVVASVRAGVAFFMLAATWGGCAFAINVVALHTATILAAQYMYKSRSVVLELDATRGEARGGGSGGCEPGADGSTSGVSTKPVVSPGLYAAYTITVLVGGGLSVSLVPFHTAGGSVLGFALAMEHALPMFVLVFLHVCLAIKLGTTVLARGSPLGKKKRRRLRSVSIQRWALLVTLVSLVASVVGVGAFRGGRYTWLLDFVVRPCVSVGGVRLPASSATLQDDDDDDR